MIYMSDWKYKTFIEKKRILNNLFKEVEKETKEKFNVNIKWD